MKGGSMENRLFCAEMTGQGELRHGVLKKMVRL